ncbi:MAG: autotransporter-associated beta strand repeat-containing protein [Thermoguttaceae bacterium]
MNAKSATICLLVLFAVVASAAHGSTINIPLVTVGDPGNVADPLTGYGSVPYIYEMAEYDVTVGQYCQFLNAVAKTDTYGLYNAAMAPGASGGIPTFGIARSSTSGNYSYSVAGRYSQAANCPIFDVSWGDAARFVNWLQNGQPAGAEGTGTTETGTYTLNGGTSNAALMAVTRNPGSTWVLPTVNEWYKSAYYVGGGTNAGYWTFATQSNDAPSNVLSATGTNNANFTNTFQEPPFSSLTDPVNYLTPVGAFAASPSAYGTFDQNGDVDQWNETAYSSSSRWIRGGNYGSTYGILAAVSAGSGPPDFQNNADGFRVASVPEATSLCLLLIGATALVAWRVGRFLARDWLKRYVLSWRRNLSARMANSPATMRWHENAKRRPVGFQSLQMEGLEERRLLTPFFWDPAAPANSPWVATTNAASYWHAGSIGGARTIWVAGSTADFQASGANQVLVNSPVNLGGITIEQNASCQISGANALSITANSTTTVDVEPGATGEIYSSITGSGSTLIKAGNGALVLGASGSVTVAAMEDVDSGTLEIDTNVSITNSNNSGVGLQVDNSAILQGTGTIALVATSPLSYDSSAASTFSGSITGAGGVEVDTPYLDTTQYSNTLTLDGSKGGNNTYIGKTDIEDGTLRLANGAAPGADTGALQVGGNGELDLNGCSITVGSLNDGTSGTGGLITDNSFDENYGGITWLTVATPYGESHIFHGSIQDSRVAPVIGLVMSGKGTLTLAGANGYVGGTEINDGTLELVAPTTGTALPYGPLSVNSPGMLDLNGESIEVSTLDGSGTIFDNSNPGPTTVLKVTMSRPCVFAGVIENGLVAGGQQHVVSLHVTGDGPLTLTGQITCSGGTQIKGGCLQIGDGVTNGQVIGDIYDESPGGLIFDVTGSAPQEFQGEIYTDPNLDDLYNGGSVEKTGDGTLTFSSGVDGTQYTYPGQLQVEGGTLVLGDSYVLPTGASVTVEKGATLNLDGNIFPVASVSLNGGSSIVSTNASGTNTPATLTASESFNFASGSIGPDVTLTGAASLNKRTSGTVTIDVNANLEYGGGTFIDDPDGQLLDDNNGQLTSVVPTPQQILYWYPSQGLGGTGTWDNDAANKDWSTSYTTDKPVAWSDNDIAVFEGSPGKVTISGAVSPAEIEFNVGGYDLEDVAGSEISVLYSYENLLVSVPANVADTLGCVISGGGSLTMEGGGTLALTGTDGNNTSTYAGGTFIDAGTVQAGSQTALSYGDLTVDDTGELDLNGNNITVTSLSSAGLQSGTITDNSTPPQENPVPTKLTVDLGGNYDFVNEYIPHPNTNPGVFGGVIRDGINHAEICLQVCAELDSRSLLLTLTGQNTYSGGTLLGGELQLGDGTNDGSITGVVQLSHDNNFDATPGGIVFDVAAGTETFNGTLTPSVFGPTGDVTKTGAGTLVLNGDNTYANGTTTVEDGVLQLGDDGALPADSYLTIDGGTLDLGNHKTNELAGVTLISGSIWQQGGQQGAQEVPDGVGTALSYGQLVSDSFTFENSANCEVTANLAGKGSLAQNGSGLTLLSGYNTYTGATIVSAGELEVDGQVSGTVTVSQGATLAGMGTCPGTVTIMCGGTLLLGGATGPAPITLGSLTLDPGSFVTDIVGAQDTYLADITGALIIDPTVCFNTTVSGSGTVPYQVIFHYGSLNSGGFLNLTAQTGTNLVNNTPANSIDLGYPAGGAPGGTSGTTLLYWAGVTGGIWNGLTSNTDWWTSPTGGLTTCWVKGDVAIFENLGQSQTVTIDSGYQAQPAATFIMGNCTINANPNGQFSLGTGGAPITVGAGITAVITAPVSGGALVANLTGGTLNLTNGGNSYNGGTTINGGTLQVTSGSCLGSGATITFDGGTLGLYQATGALDFSASMSVVLDQAGGTIDANGFNVEIDGAIMGSGGLTKIGNNTLTLTADNNYNGGTTINGGILNIQNGSALGNMAGGVYVANGATLQLQDSITVAATTSLVLNGTGDGGIGALDSLAGSYIWSGPILLGASGAQIDSNSGQNGLLSLTLGIDGEVAGSSLAFDGAGNFSVSNVPNDMGIGSNVAYVTENCTGTLTLEVADSYTGGLTVLNGRLVAYPGAIPSGPSLSVGGSGGTIFNGPPVYSSINVANGATLNLGGYSVTVTGSVTLANGSITGGTIIDNDAYSVQNGTISANLGGSAGLTMSGTGTVDLTGNNSYTGGMTIDSGALILAGSDSFSGATVVSSGSTLTVAATGTLTIAATGSLTVASGGSLVVASGGTLNNGGTLNDAAAVLGGNGSDNIVNSGTLVIDGQGTQKLNCQLTGSGKLAVTGGATFDLAGDNLTFSAVTVNGGSVIDSSGGNGSLTADGFTLVNTTVNATLYDSSGTDMATGTVILNDQTCNSLLNNLSIPSGCMLDINGGTATLGGNTVNDGTLAVGNGGLFANAGTFTNNKTITIAAGGSFYNCSDLAGTAGGTLNNYGRIYIDGWFQNEGARTGGVIYASTLSNYGTILNYSDGTFYNGLYASYTGNGYFSNSGAFLDYGGSSMVNANGGMTNNSGGTFTISGPGSEFQNESSSGFTNAAGGTVNVIEGAVFQLTSGSLTNAGTFDVTASTLNVESGNTLNNSGAIALATDAVFNNWGTVDNTDSVTRPSGCAVNNYATWEGNQPVA